MPSNRVTWSVVAVVLLSIAAVPTCVVAADGGRRRFVSGSAGAQLTEVASKIAVVLDTAEGESSAVISLREFIASEPALQSLKADDEQGYANLWFVRVAEGVSNAEHDAILDRLDALASVRFAAPLLCYGPEADLRWLIPKPELLLATRDGDSATRVAERYGLVHIRELTSLTTLNHYRAPVAARDVGLLSQTIARDADVLWCEPNFVDKLVPPTTTPNDPLFADQWAHDNTGQSGGTAGADLNATAAWDRTTGSASITIAIVDEGVDMDHEDLATNVIGGHDSTDQAWPEGVAGNAAPGDGHGTACAGIAAAVGDNGIGVAGVAWNAKILSVRLGYGGHWTEDAWINDALTWAADNGADVLSNSWGGGPPTMSVLDAIQYVQATGRGGLGCVVLFASGNDEGTVSYPAAYPETIAVGATSPCDERKSPASCDGETWWGSNYGSALSFVVPGVLIHTTDIMGSGGYASGNYMSNFNGTSSACPRAAGAAALLLSYDPSLTADEARARLEGAGIDEVGLPSEDTPGFDVHMGWGRLDLDRLLAFVDALAPPTAFACVVSDADVELSWLNASSYDSIIVRRDGIDIATIAGSATSYSDAAVAVGSHDYEIVAVGGSEAILPVRCRVFVDDMATDLVWAPEVGSVDGGAALVDSLTANGKVVVEVAELSDVADIDAFERVWVALGIFPDNTVLDGGNAAVLADFVTNGIGGSRLYLEGGDTWAFDTQTALHALFDIDGQDDGSDDLDAVVGSGQSPCDLSGFDLTYTGENAWIDQLAPLASAFAIQHNNSPSYDVAIYNGVSDYRLIGASHEFGGYADGATTRADLMEAYLDCFGDVSLAPVEQLGCSVSGIEVDLYWTNGDNYTSIEIARDGAAVASLPGTASFYHDATPGAGSHGYDVVAVDGASPASAVSCSVAVPPASPTSIDCSVTPGTVDLSWINADNYDTITIERDSSVIATLAGSATVFVDGSPLVGSHDYAVIAELQSLTADPVTCTVSYVEPPSIVTDPMSSALCSGGDLTLSVVASGSDLSYQWRRGGVDIGGATSDTLTIGSVMLGDAGDYDVIVDNSAGSATSQVATVDVISAPTIDTAPPSQTVAVGSDVTFTVVASGTTPMTYQWQYEGVDISGATLPTLALTSVASPAAGDYTVTVANVCGEAASAPATLTVDPPFAISALSCCPQGLSVDLCWTNGQSYDAIELYRDGALLATLAGTTTCYTTMLASAGSYGFALVGIVLGDAAAPTACSVTVVDPPSEVACVVIDPTHALPDVELTWTGVEVGAFVDIERDGLPFATTPGESASYVDADVTPGTHTYTLVARVPGNCDAVSVPANCEVDVPAQATFVRGDSNDDLSINLADVVFALNWLFTAGVDPNCFDAMDTNDDGVLDISDPIFALAYAFQSGPAPPSPFPGAGSDPTDDGLDCASSAWE